MKILLTGANGFLGRTLQAEWSGFHETITLGRDKKAMIVCNLSEQVPVIPNVDMVVHAAGKAHVVPKSPEEKQAFFSVNVQGTKNLLAALEHHESITKFVFISSVAVYGLMEGFNIGEDAPLLATEPYGKSKIEAEQLVLEWCAKRNIEFYILRLPLVAGKNAPGNLGAMVKGIRSGKYLSIGKAMAKKSMILAKDLANFLVVLQGHSGVYNLTDGYHPSFSELESTIAAFCDRKQPYSLPLALAKLVGYVGDIIPKFPVNSNKLKKITSTLTFDDSKARAKLNWNPNEILKAWEIE